MVLDFYNLAGGGFQKSKLARASTITIKLPKMGKTGWEVLA
jgi:hypothetical protein